MKFTAFNLKNELILALNSLRYFEATQIQEAVINPILNGKSIIAKSETGSGKTHAFLIPIINQLENRSFKQPEAIIISPTIELATQTYQFAKELIEAYNPELSVKLLTGLNDAQDSLELQKKMPQIIISTPAKLRQISSIRRAKTIVLDEADMLFEEIYIEDIHQILSAIDCAQRLVFTATMKEHLLSDAKKYIQAQQIIDVDKSFKANRNITHYMLNTKHRDTYTALKLFLELHKPYFAMVFGSTKQLVSSIYRKLNEDGITVAMISGDMDSRERKLMLKRINNGDFQLIVCSDIASRGLDFDNVSDVISLDLPKDINYYFHRAGRTGRNQKTGNSYVFYDDDHKYKIKELKKSKIEFKFLTLKNEGIVEDKVKIKKKQVNEVLEAKIKKEISKVKSKKVKPNYKKKMRLAASKAEKAHHREVVRKNIREQERKNKNFKD